MKKTLTIVWSAGVVVAAVAATIAGCAGSSPAQPDATPAAPLSAQSKPAQAGPEGKPTELSGALLWAQTCGQCHNTRAATDYSDSQWAVAVMHMRIQARLTGEEERKIRQFLQASN